MDEQNKSGGSLIEEILFAVKRYFTLIVVIVLLCSACGLGYSFIKEPNYTAYEEVIYIASAEKGSNTVTDINIMDSFYDTILDFCDEGVVVDRANYYYYSFYNSAEELTLNALEDFLSNVELEGSYDPGIILKDKYICKNSVIISVEVESNNQNEYAFSVGYTDKDENEAKIKARIYVEAIKRELQATSNLSDSGNSNQSGSIYFKGINISINSLGSAGITSDVSKTKFTVVGFAIGVIVAAVLVYVLNVTDSSVRNKEELEKLTGVNHISNIDYIGGKK